MDQNSYIDRGGVVEPMMLGQDVTIDAKKDSFNPFHNTSVTSGEMTIQRNIETPGRDEKVYMQLR